MKVIILGCDSLGAYLATILQESSHQVTIIEESEDRLRSLPATFDGSVIIGDGTDQEVLRRAGIEGADVFVGLDDQDNHNIMACQLAKVIFDVPKVICQIKDIARQQAFKELGLTTFSPISDLAKIIKRDIER